VGLDPQAVGRIGKIEKVYENIAGVEVPILQRVDFEPLDYSLYDTPSWLDPLIKTIEETKLAKVKIEIAEERQRALEKELREVSIRVNLFEKVLIPKSLKNIKKIKVFLDDQQLAFVSQAKAAKRKIEERKGMR
jgi:V/A-type H+-transporting ATPase subunit D